MLKVVEVMSSQGRPFSTFDQKNLTVKHWGGVIHTWSQHTVALSFVGKCTCEEKAKKHWPIIEQGKDKQMETVERKAKESEQTPQASTDLS